MVKSRILRGALVGCGFFSPNHLHAWRSVGANIVAVCDLEPSRARAMAEKFAVPSAYTELSELLKSEAIDFVDIATTASAHRALVELAAGKVKLVICQKPFAESLPDADAMVTACELAGTILLVHENFRWQRPFREMERRIRAGAIGQPQALRLSFRHDYDIYANQPYLARLDRLALMDVGLHLFDLARFFLGEVRSLHCRTLRLNPDIRGEDFFVASLSHDTSAITTIDCSFFAVGCAENFPQTFAWVDGSEGALELAGGYRLIERHRGRRLNSNVEPEVPSWGQKPWHCIQDSVINFNRHAVNVLEGREQPEPSGNDNRKTLALTLAAYRSAQSDQSLRLELPAPGAPS